jgi:hypothetical protein
VGRARGLREELWGFSTGLWRTWLRKCQETNTSFAEAIAFPSLTTTLTFQQNLSSSKQSLGSWNSIAILDDKSFIHSCTLTLLSASTAILTDTRSPLAKGFAAFSHLAKYSSSLVIKLNAMEQSALYGCAAPAKLIPTHPPFLFFHTTSHTV